MPKVMRMARGASIAAVVVAALALGACANNKDLAGQGLAGHPHPCRTVPAPPLGVLGTVDDEELRTAWTRGDSADTSGRDRPAAGK